MPYHYFAGKYSDSALEGARTASLPQNNTQNNEHLIKEIGKTMDAKGGININDVNGNSVKIESNHAYEVKYNKDDGTVTVTNPWNTSKNSYTFDKSTFKEVFQIDTTNKQSTATTLWKHLMW